MPIRRIASPGVTKRIASAVQATERRLVYRGGPRRPRWFQRDATGEIRTCVVTTSITARSGTTLGTGVVKFCITDAVAGTEVVSTDPDDVVTVRNSYTATFAADATKRRKVHYEAGCWKILTGDC